MHYVVAQSSPRGLRALEKSELLRLGTMVENGPGDLINFLMGSSVGMPAAPLVLPSAQKSKTCVESRSPEMKPTVSRDTAPLAINSLPYRKGLTDSSLDMTPVGKGLKRSCTQDFQSPGTLSRSCTMDSEMLREIDQVADKLQKQKFEKTPKVKGKRQQHTERDMQGSTDEPPQSTSSEKIEEKIEDLPPNIPEETEKLPPKSPQKTQPNKPPEACNLSCMKMFCK